MFFVINKNNRLLTETKPGSVKSYTYDANGNMLSGDGATYTYDARDRQSSYVKGSTLASYTYYPTGLRKSHTASLVFFLALKSYRSRRCSRGEENARTVCGKR